MKTSILDILRIGIGPSSSHTVGPMRASREFLVRLGTRLVSVDRLLVELYGSLALTGHGHGTDRAILLGLEGCKPELVDPELIDETISSIRNTQKIKLLGERQISFGENLDLVFHRDIAMPGHPNTLRLTAFDDAGDEIETALYYSVGGGFIAREGEVQAREEKQEPPYPFSSAEELLRLGERHGLAIWQIVLANEERWRGEADVRAYVAKIWNTMQGCVARGLKTEGILPGGLKVRRRAPNLARRLAEKKTSDPLGALDWVNAFAFAVNEENAAGGRVVTAPTNGAAGVIPAVAHYYEKFVPEASEDGLFRFLLTAGAIGILYKENASISGAEVGCQGEVGVACSMAAGGLVAALGGTNDQVEHAAEIGMEHHLGMTCDPIAGLVQIPCIERNGVGAVKAINACRMAMQEPEHKVSLDQVIETMYKTGLDMQTRYKETSQAGLALNIIEC
ncbi:L-serine ammonia-lyase [Candidatus Koribacter versatilis Ellin345]|uniref:L-serine dehydratase n=1 Tax=Koribacter versatilis (strain Ellin345) TaxID=204669 RepID=Q1ITA0_KORVE|nr:L-serine ammonia-lyase [Candidatus Koribacter versatilis]ABF39900.1 L-serine ammonia-lyase [Candidatus Koribacter versatilis Ellin345]